MKHLKILTWNVNSIRARLENLSLLVEQNVPDIILLQETKCEDQSFPLMDIMSIGYNCVISGQKSYNGVAILSKSPITLEIKKLPSYDIDNEDHEARYLECTIEHNNNIIRAISVYVPNGDSKLEKGEVLEDSKRFKYKLNFLRRLKKRMTEILSFENELTILGGDYNVAHNEIDLYNPENAEGGVGFHKDERTLFQSLLDVGYTDIWRHFHKDQTEYSWWDYRRNGWENNRGWRIDYILGCNRTLKRTESCSIEKSMRIMNRPSDHVPVTINLELT